MTILCSLALSINLFVVGPGTGSAKSEISPFARYCGKELIEKMPGYSGIEFENS